MAVDFCHKHTANTSSVVTAVVPIQLGRQNRIYNNWVLLLEVKEGHDWLCATQEMGSGIVSFHMMAVLLPFLLIFERGEER